MLLSYMSNIDEVSLNFFESDSVLLFIIRYLEAVLSDSSKIKFIRLLSYFVYSFIRLHRIKIICVFMNGKIILTFVVRMKGM